MLKSTKKFYNLFIQLSFWDSLTRHFEEFENLLNPPEVLSGEDKATLENIHTLIYQSYQSAKQCKELYLHKIKNLKNKEQK